MISYRLLFRCFSCFFLWHFQFSYAFSASSTVRDQNILKSWRQKIDVLLDPRLPLFERQIISKDLINDIPQISKDVRRAIEKGGARTLIDDVILAPGSEARRSINGIRTVQRQLQEDILPDILQKRTPEQNRKSQEQIRSFLFDELPKNARSLTEDIPKQIAKVDFSPKGIFKAVQSVQDEAFSSTPKGLYTPEYQVLYSNNPQNDDNDESAYEIRKYSTISLATTIMTTLDDDESNANGKAFNTLASYLFGSNSDKTAMEMTTPVSIDIDLNSGTSDNKRSASFKTMSFVLPENMEVKDAPMPNDSRVLLQQIPERLVAVRKFTGFATPKEVEKQSSELKKALLTDGWIIETPQDNEPDCQLLQYNSPFTLPWLRRNEIVIRVLDKDDIDT